MASEKATSTETTPVWCTGPEQVEVEIVVTGEMYNVDVDIAKRMGIIQGKSQQGFKFESPFGLTGCSSRDFELALVFCANDREGTKPPSTELERIIKETAMPNADADSSAPAEPKPTREAAVSAIQKGFAELSIGKDEDDEDEDDGSYSPSESEASDSGDEYSDTDPTDIGTANIKAERDEYHARQKEKENVEAGEEQAQT